MNEGLLEQRRSLYEFVRIHGAERRYLEHAVELEALRKAVFDMGVPAFEAAADVALEPLMRDEEALGIETQIDFFETHHLPAIDLVA